MTLTLTEAGKSLGISTEAVERLVSAARACVTSGSAPACQIAVAHRGELVASGTFGEADDDDRFIIYSATKPIVAAAAIALVSKAGIPFSTPVAELLASFTSRKSTVTLEQVFTHTSGFPSALMPIAIWDDPEARANRIESWELEYDPGSRFVYHGSSAHWVLVDVIEHLASERYQDVVNRKLLAPMHLDQLTLGVPEGSTTGLTVAATGELSDPADVLLIRGSAEAASPDHFLAYNDPDIRRFGSPSSGCVADASSLALLYQQFLANATPGLWGSVDGVDATRSVRTQLPVAGLGVSASRSLGWMVAGAGRTHFRHRFGDRFSELAFGHAGAGGQVTWADPASGSSLAFLANAIDRDVIRDHRSRRAISDAAAAMVAPANLPNALDISGSGGGRR